MTVPSVASNRRRIIPGLLLVLVIAIGIGIWFVFVRDDSPSAFSIDDATAGLVTDDTSGDSSSLDGTWMLDPDAGADVGGSSAGFRVDEELASIGATTAVGRTESVDGRLTISGTQVSGVEIIVDMASLATDDSRRDGKMRAALGTAEFPTATFVTTRPIELVEIPADGETITVTAVGEMTIKGVTNEVEVALDAQVVDGTLVIVGSMPVVFDDYGVETPSAAIVVSLEDAGIIEFQLFFTPA